MLIFPEGPLNRTFINFKEKPMWHIPTIIWGTGGDSAREQGVLEGLFRCQNLARLSSLAWPAKMFGIFHNIVWINPRTFWPTQDISVYTWLPPRRRGKREGCGGRWVERESRKVTSLRWAGCSDLTGEGKEALTLVYLVALAFILLNISSL